MQVGSGAQRLSTEWLVLQYGVEHPESEAMTTHIHAAQRLRMSELHMHFLHLMLKYLDEFTSTSLLSN